MTNPVEHVKAKVAGMAGAVEARMKGLKGVFRKLSEQHHEVSSLLATAVETDDYTKRAALWADIRRELVSHEQAELLQVYPVIEEHEITKDIGHRHTESAGELEAAVRELDGLGFQSDAWRAGAERLLVIVREHARVEEEEFFPRAQEALGEQVAQALEPSFTRAKALAAERLG